MIESCYFESFYHVPTYERLLINREGRVIDLRTMFCHLEAKGDHEYPAVNIYGYGTIFIHRLLALTFIPFDPRYKNLQVNHIDGDKNNNDLTNLEWVLPSGNITHAFASGLRSDAKPVLCRNIETGEVKRFYSSTDCARFFKVTVNTILTYIRSKSPYPFNIKYELVHEENDWKNISIENIVNVEPRDNSIVAISESVVKIFDSVHAAARYLNLSISKIYHSVNYNSGVLIGNYVFFYVNEYAGSLDDAIYIAGSFREGMGRHRKNPIRVTEIVTGHVTQWDSVEDFSWVVGVRRNTITKSMGKNDGHWDKYKIEYLNVKSV